MTRTRWMVSLVMGFLAVSAASATAPALGEDKGVSKPATPITGMYKFVSGEKFGGAAPEENLKHAKVSITNEEIIALDRDSNRTYVASYTLDTSKKPWRIQMIALAPEKGAKAEGLVEKDGETVRIIYALPGSEAPTEFKTKDRQMMFVLEALPMPGDRK